MQIDIDRLAYELAAVQHGAFSRRQLLDGGAEDKTIRRRLREGRWVKVAEGVYVLAGLPPDPERPLWVAWLAVGLHAVVSHESAAERHGLAPVIVGRLVFTTSHGDHHRIAGVTVHQLRDLLDHHVEPLGGLPTTTIERTIVDLAAVCSTARVSRVVENAINGHQTSEAAVARTLREVARRGKPGVGALGRVLDERSPGEPVADSELERMLLRAVFRAGNPPPVPQYPHPGRHPGRGRVDFAYPEAKLILEADGRRWHQRIADLKRDRARDNEAARAGWLTLRFMHEELSSDPEDVGATVRDVLAQRVVEASKTG